MSMDKMFLKAFGIKEEEIAVITDLINLVLQNKDKIKELIDNIDGFIAMSKILNEQAKEVNNDR